MFGILWIPIDYGVIIFSVMQPKRAIRIYRILQFLLILLETGVIAGFLIVFDAPIWLMVIPLAVFISSVWPLTSSKKAAWKIEKASPEVLEERLVSYVELQKNLPDYARPFVKRLEDELKGRLDWKVVLRAVRPNITAWRIAYLVVIVGLIRMIFAYRPMTYVQIAPKYAEVFEDSTLVLDAFDLPSNGKLVLEPHVQNPKTVSVGEGLSKCVLGKLSPGTYRLFAEGKRIISDTAEVVVWRLPVVESLTITVRRIDHELTLNDPTYVVVRQGTPVRGRVKITDADTARIFFVSQNDSNLIINCAGDGGDTFRFVPDSSGVLKIWLKKGIVSTWSPRRVRIDVVEDEPPYIAFIEPKSDIDLPDDGIVFVKGFAEDDFGLEKIVVFVEFRDTKKQMGQVMCNNEPTDTAEFKLDLNELGMFPGDVATITLGALDIGGHWSFTEPISVRFPTLDELYNRTAEAAQAGKRDISQLSSKLDELNRKMREAQEMLRASKNLSWEERQKVEQTLKQVEEMIEQLNQKIENLKRSLEKIQSISLDPELSQKIEEISRLLNEIMPETLQKRLQELSEALKKQDIDEIDKILSQMQIDQELLKEQLERTQRLLKRFEEEMKLKEFAERLEELATQQELLMQDLMKADKEELPELSEKQKELEAQLDSLMSEMESLASDTLTSQKVRDTLSSMAQNEGSKISERMQTARVQMTKGMKNQAIRSQKEAKEGMMELAERLRNFRKSLVNLRKQQVLQQVQRLQFEALSLSEMQENLMNNLELGQGRPLKLAARQMTIQRALERLTVDLVELGKNSLFITPRVIGTFAMASHLALSASNSLELGHSSIGRMFADSTLKYINLGLYQLMETEQNIQASQSSTGLQEVMNQLNQLMQQQNRLTSSTQSLLPIPMPIPQAIMSQLQQLAEAQSRIASQLQELSSRIGDRMLSEAMRAAAQEAQEIAEQLKSGRVDQQLVERQKNLTEKLLSAQRAMKKREFVRKREAKPGREAPAESPPPVRALAERERLKNALLNVRRYPQAYRRLIEAYYRTLLGEGQ